MRISLLSHPVQELIAAGEVIERPVSVVKELLENAIDAGASRISVSISDGGRREIRVSDDGQGINPEDMPLALQRFATSKMKVIDDLGNIGSLGFRGEALASIRAVSRLSLCSRRRDSEEGRRLQSLPDQEAQMTTVGAPPGTSVTVSDLFFNLPARKKFLRSRQTEQRRIQVLLEKYSLAYPDIAFRLEADDRLLLDALPASSRADRIIDVYGPRAGGLFIEVSQTGTSRELNAWVSAPTFSRSNRNEISMFVNGRWVQSGVLRFALERAYRQILPPGRYPVAVIELRLPPQLIDVNVHPQKAEVRIEDERELAEWMEGCIRRKITASLLQPEATAAAVMASEPKAEGLLYRLHNPKELLLTAEPSSVGLTASQTDSLNAVAAAPNSPALIGQAMNSFIIACDETNLFIIDQHAAHERIIYDRLMSSTKEGNEIASQQMLLPDLLELSLSESSALKLHLDTFSQLGFDLQPFGKNSFRLSRLPLEAVGLDFRALVLDILAELELLGKVQRQDDRRSAACIRLACLAAVKAGKPLARSEMQVILQQSLGDPQSLPTCPHGRPAALRISCNDLCRSLQRK